ncbi:MAG: hypothetical protein U0236_10960 [Nitrospira sp.]
MKVRANPRKAVVTVELTPTEAMRWVQRLVEAALTSAPGEDWSLVKSTEPQQEERQES